MDSTNIAVAGIALFGLGIIGFFGVTAFFAVLAIGHAVVPRLRPLAQRFASDAKTWAMPPQPPRVAMSRGAVRPAPRR